MDNRYLEAGAAEELDEATELDLSDELLDEFSEDFDLSVDLAAGLSDFSDLSDFSALSDDEPDDSPFEALIELLAASRLSLR